MIFRNSAELPRTALRARLVPSPPLFCNSSDTAIAIPRASRAHRLARWHRFVSIEHREPLQTALQGTSARAMFCRKLAELPHTAVQGHCPPFLQFIWHGNRHSRGLQGIFARAMAPICVHRAPRTPPDIALRHIGSRDDLLESVTSIGEAAFYNCPTIIYVPLGSEGTYKKGWSKYRSRIFGYDYSAAE